MKQLTTTNYTNCTNWLCRSWRVLFLLAIANCQLSIVISIKAQDENAAFYIYQKGGRVNGFFYDEVEKITYSYYDNQGIAYDEYMSQEVVTEDSTYRFLLSDIDSIGFVQPMTKMGPKVRIIDQRTSSGAGDYLTRYLWQYDMNNCMLRFCSTCDIPRDQYPKVGDVFIVIFVSTTWGMKVESVSELSDGIYAYGTPITDFSDIYQQLVTVEQYGYDDSGKMVRRRVAGHPELNVGQFSRRAKGKFEGDIFNFSLNGHFPLYNGDGITASIDPSLKGKVHARVDWNLPVLGSKYIGITTRLDLGVQMGFTVTGKIGEAKKGGFGSFATIPLPATCPILTLEMGPDMFIRGQADLKFMASTSEAKGSIWSKLEIKDWWPSFSCGKGNPDEGNETPNSGSESGNYQMELSGWVQTGCNFPMKFASLPIMKRIFNATIGGEWFIGPKISGSIAFDFTEPKFADTFMYNQLKNTKFSMSLCDADYEISADVESAFSSRKKWTLADGTFNLFQPLEVSFVPEFGNCVEYDEDRYLPDNEGGVTKVPCRVFAFEPTGNVFKPVKVGVICYELDENGKEVTWWSMPNRAKLYHQVELMTEHERNTWPEIVFNYPNGCVGYSKNPVRYRFRPFVELFQKTYAADPYYDYVEKPYLGASSNTLYIEYDGEVKTPVKLEGICDNIFAFDNHSVDAWPYFPEWINITDKGEGKFEISVTDMKKFQELQGYNHTPGDTLLFLNTSYKGTGNRNGFEIESNGLTLTTAILPNKSVDPVQTIVTKGYMPDLRTEHFNYIQPKDFPTNMNHKFTRNTNNDGWHCEATSADETGQFKMEYDILCDEGNAQLLPSGQATRYSRRFYVRNGTLTYSWTETRMSRDVEHTLSGSLTGTFANESGYFNLDKITTGYVEPSFAQNLRYTLREDDGPEQSTTMNRGLNLKICFPEYFDQPAQ